MRDINYFKSCFGGRFWKKLNESLIPFQDKVKNKDQFLNDLYTQLITKEYQPDLIRECIISNKQNRVARIVPAFTRKDYCIYFYCLKSLEKFIANNRVDGTFGGWTLGNGIKDFETEEEIKKRDEAIDDIPSSSDNSYNPFAWRKHWKEFQSLAFYHYQNEDNIFFLKLDIANFYDCIRLDILEDNMFNALYKAEEKDYEENGDIVDYTDEIELLFYFLKFWNRKLEEYKVKCVGVPQDEVGDCSRILANFYLQQYDKKINELCEEEGATYLRYADDQIIFAKNEKIARNILFQASKELHKIGLNINPSKVDEFDNRSDFATYWSFDIFTILTDDNKKNKIVIEDAIKLFRDRKTGDKKFKSHMVLNRLIYFELNFIEPSLKHYLISILFDKEYLGLGNYRIFRNINNILTDEQKKDFYKILDELIDEINFNFYHYHLQKFYKAYRKDFDFSILEERIRLLKI